MQVSSWLDDISSIILYYSSVFPLPTLGVRQVNLMIAYLESFLKFPNKYDDPGLYRLNDLT